VIGYLSKHEIALTWDPAAAALKARAPGTAKTVTVKRANPAAKPVKGRRRKARNADRPALAAARARVAIRRARKQAVMGY